jgi:hypothetical protein
MSNNFTSSFIVESSDIQIKNLASDHSTQGEGGENGKQPRAFKFGQVDQKLLMSRLYSTPFKKATSNQQFALEMGATSVHKPRIKKLESPPPHAEPIVFIQVT